MNGIKLFRGNLSLDLHWPIVKQCRSYRSSGWRSCWAWCDTAKQEVSFTVMQSERTTRAGRGKVNKPKKTARDAVHMQHVCEHGTTEWPWSFQAVLTYVFLYKENVHMCTKSAVRLFTIQSFSYKNGDGKARRRNFGLKRSRVTRHLQNVLFCSLSVVLSCFDSFWPEPLSQDSHFTSPNTVFFVLLASV